MYELNPCEYIDYFENTDLTEYFNVLIEDIP